MVLDEPTSGLDVPAAHAVEWFILDAKASGKWIVLSTHIMEEAEYLCDRIAVIHQGRPQALGTMDDLRARLHHAALHVWDELLHRQIADDGTGEEAVGGVARVRPLEGLRPALGGAGFDLRDSEDPRVAVEKKHVDAGVTVTGAAPQQIEIFFDRSKPEGQILSGRVRQPGQPAQTAAVSMPRCSGTTCPILGKLFATFAATISTAMLSVASLALSFFLIRRSRGSMSNAEFSFDHSTVALLALATLPMAVLSAALILAIAAFRGARVKRPATQRRGSLWA